MPPRVGHAEPEGSPSVARDKLQQLSVAADEEVRGHAQAGDRRERRIRGRVEGVGEETHHGVAFEHSRRQRDPVNDDERDRLARRAGVEIRGRDLPRRPGVSGVVHAKANGAHRAPRQSIAAQHGCDLGEIGTRRGKKPCGPRSPFGSALRGRARDRLDRGRAGELEHSGVRVGLVELPLRDELLEVAAELRCLELFIRGNAGFAWGRSGAVRRGDVIACPEGVFEGTLHRRCSRLRRADCAGKCGRCEPTSSDVHCRLP